MLWDVPKIQEHWFDIEGWLQANVGHCMNVPLSKEIILGSKGDIATDRLFDLCILIAKYHTLSSKLQGTTPDLNVFVRSIKSTFEVEKDYYKVRSKPNKFRLDWMMYRPYLA